MPQPRILALSKSPKHSFSKENVGQINLLAGLGVEGDAHMGKTVKHRSRVAKDPTQPNLRQVHLIHCELHEELAEKGFPVAPGQMGENITTKDLGLLELPQDTLLEIGETAVLRITGLRNPCAQLEGIQKGLMKAVLDRDKEGNLIRKAGIMAVVESGGPIKVGDFIIVRLPEKPYIRLEKV